jgi:hypothetical protein
MHVKKETWTKERLVPGDYTDGCSDKYITTTYTQEWVHTDFPDETNKFFERVQQLKRVITGKKLELQRCIDAYEARVVYHERADFEKKLQKHESLSSWHRFWSDRPYDNSREIGEKVREDLTKSMKFLFELMDWVEVQKTQVELFYGPWKKEHHEGVYQFYELYDDAHQKMERLLLPLEVGV